MHAKYYPSAKLIARLEGSGRLIAGAAKLSISPRELEDILEEMSEDKAEEWVRELVRRGHGSPLEHSLYVFEVVCSRVCSHQLVRHRHASFTQLSQRYSDRYLRGVVARAREVLGGEVSGLDEVAVLDKLTEADLDFNTLLSIVGEGFIIPPRVIELKDSFFLKKLAEGVRNYYISLRSGVSYEDARFLLPQAVKTRLVFSANARELLEVFIPLRTCSRAQWEIRWVAWMVREELAKAEPVVFKYAGPRCVLAENRVRANPCSLEDFIEGRCSFTIERCPELVPNHKIRDCLVSSVTDYLRNIHGI